jgi:hypothetical protein
VATAFDDPPGVRVDLLRSLGGGFKNADVLAENLVAWVAHHHAIGVVDAGDHAIETRRPKAVARGADDRH